ncbi:MULTISPECIES: thiamine pyrophosphate-dependent enzyme [unclassified Chelatococcus]|uniref:thiamine pyrophosphate-dependent enzyme n=1 Tax=unclassified Chelatococcus TaxID=2638111 RepID=UPI001BCB9941|nr:MULTISPECIES: thiamine pyrophosphate-dependent enzyme [unclassified Chelatococcus]MBS7701542.1 aldehyde dehydrogenase [Chelatococcus sp. YT9]MBX3557377.1 aldehyde dehydrogenase [Chelatococcus sp.]
MTSQMGAMNRRRAVSELLKNRGDILAVSGLGSPTYDLFAAGDHDGNFYLWGAMGGCALVAMGLAIAQPERPVVAITGDGEQLMGIGGLLTIAVKKPANLTVAVLDNGHFGETGMQRSHSGLGVNLASIGEAAGFARTDDISDLADIESYREILHSTTIGPRFVRLQISSEELPRTFPPRDGTFMKNRFREYLGYGVD